MAMPPFLSKGGQYGTHQNVICCDRLQKQCTEETGEPQPPELVPSPYFLGNGTSMPGPQVEAVQCRQETFGASQVRYPFRPPRHESLRSGLRTGGLRLGRCRRHCRSSAGGWVLRASIPSYKAASACSDPPQPSTIPWLTPLWGECPDAGKPLPWRFRVPGR